MIKVKTLSCHVRICMYEPKENIQFYSILNDCSSPKWRFTKFPRFWKKKVKRVWISDILIMFSKIIHYRVCLGKMRNNWKFWNCCGIFDIYTNCLLINFYKFRSISGITTGKANNYRTDHERGIKCRVLQRDNSACYL